MSLVAELFERISQVFGQNVPDVGHVHVGRQGQRHGQEVGAIAPACGRFSKKPAKMKERQFSGDAAQLESSGHRSTRQSHDSSFFLFKKLERNEEKEAERQRERDRRARMPACVRVRKTKGWSVYFFPNAASCAASVIVFASNFAACRFARRARRR